MEISKIIDSINVKISGLCTLVLETNESKQAFTHKTLYDYNLYQVDYPDCTRVLLKNFQSENYDLLEADIVEYLFDIIITEKYKK
jgi:hypothetical protein